MAYYFNLPLSTDLTRDQQLAVDETEPIALSGGPGTGKTVVNLWRHIFNYVNGSSKSLLITYTKTLEYYLKNAIKEKGKSEDNEKRKKRYKKASKNIDRTKRWTFSTGKSYFDEIIVDEAQDVEISLYNVIKEYSNQCSYGADEAQSVYLTPKEVKKLLKQLRKMFSENEEYTLDINFRNSQEILLFTKAVFPTISIPQRTIDTAVETGIKPLVQFVAWEDEDTIEKVLEIIEEYSSDTHNIGILFPTVKQVNKYHKLLKYDIDCTKFVSEDDVFTELANILQPLNQQKALNLTL